ncbi:MAG: DUF5627 domain-containing protein [Bacteroidales bacterium]|nr:DUF5627 domain-containing protein [Bacteroidales bacterium]
MKINKLLCGMSAMALLALPSCENGDRDFPDFDGGATVYFAYQYPVRTIVLGNDTYDTKADNEHRFAIYSVSGGTYDGVTASVGFGIEESLCNNLYFDQDKNEPVKAMPQSYYSLGSEVLQYNKQQNTYVDVQLSDEFFADPNSLKNTYVIPLRMTSASGNVSILEGSSMVESPVWQNANDWNTLPKNYVLYCVKFINKYHANYLRRGVDNITYNGNTDTKIRHNGVEKDEVCSTKSLSLNSVEYPVSTLLADGTSVTCNLVLDFDANGNCTIKGDGKYEASGSGKYCENSEIKAWGNKDRDGLYLDYTIDFGERQISTKDTLVWQSRGVSMETFSPYYIQ